MPKGGADHEQRLALGRLTPAEAVARVRAAHDEMVEALRQVVREELDRRGDLPDAALLPDTEMAKSLHMSVKGWRELYESDPGLLALAYHIGKGTKRILRWDRSAVLRHLRGRHG